MLHDRSAKSLFAQATLRNEAKRLSQQVNLACNENVLSLAGESALFSPYYSRYFLGSSALRGNDAGATIGGLVMGNLPGLSLLEERAHAAAHTIFAAEHVETRFLSGVHATTNTILALTRPGDLVLSLDPVAGGHFATRGLAEEMGRKHAFLPWDFAAHDIDLAATARFCADHKVKLVFLDCGAPLFPLAVAALREIVGTQALIAYDASHSLGLIAGGRFQAPFEEGADVLQGNTHKSLPGPHKAIALAKDASVHAAISGMLSRATVSGQDTASTAALHITLMEMEDYAEPYAAALTSNAQLFGNELRRRDVRLFEVRNAFTQTHVILVRCETDRASQAIAMRLIKAGIVCNARNLYGVPCLRIGLQEVTRRGIGHDDVLLLAGLFADGVKAEDASSATGEIASLASRLSGRAFGYPSLSSEVVATTLAA